MREIRQAQRRAMDSREREKRFVLILAAVAALAAGIVLSGFETLGRSAGQARLVSITPLGPASGMFEGEYCQWVPASAAEPLAALAADQLRRPALAPGHARQPPRPAAAPPVSCSRYGWARWRSRGGAPWRSARR